MKLGSDTADFTSYLQGFLDDIDAYFYIRESFHAYGADYFSRYTQINHLINTAKALLADIFKENLHRVYPELNFTKGNQIDTSWRIPSLSDAMYLELFFRLTSTSTVKKCANPTCPGYFQWSNSKPRRIYCSPDCATLMAKRMQREREKYK